MTKITKKTEQVVILITCLLVMATAAIQRDGRVWGHDLLKSSTDTTTTKVASDTMRTLSDGTIVINTTTLAKDISGYGGPVPL